MHSKVSSLVLAVIALSTSTSINAFTPNLSRSVSRSVQKCEVVQNGEHKSSALYMSGSTDMKKEVNVGVIGCGRIGIVHLGAISKAPGVKAVIVSNPTVSKAEAGKT